MNRRTRLLSRCAPTALLGFSLAGAAQATVTFDWATVGNAGNAADPLTGFGAVFCEYRISTTEVTNAQYAEFLNAVDPAGANGLSLYSSSMAGSFGGIELQPGNAEGSRFVAQAGRENNPVTYVSWFDSVRFINWLHNGQGSGDTETGAYTLLGGAATPSNSATIIRNFGAEYFLPSEDEWYKAAYHDASAGLAGDYFLYATGSDSVPISDQPADNTAAVNYFSNDGIANGFNDGHAVSGSFLAGPNPLTDVGAYPDAVSSYGTFDQNGNVWEWTETLFGTSNRGYRGGSWGNTALTLAPSFRPSLAPSADSLSSNSFGFRVASPGPLPPPLGDADGDCLVDLLDFDILAQQFGQNVSGGPTQGDFNSDGVVNLLDFDILAQNFGASFLVAIPEPASAALLGLAGPMLLRGRRRRRSA